MIAATRFRRFFTSGGGYTLFMPAVIKVYVEADRHPGIRYAIEYAASRFYTLHQETFVFQTLEVTTSIVMASGVDEAWIASCIHALFASIRGPTPSSAPDAAGIHGLNRPQEREALMLTAADEVPQTFLASFKGSTSKEQAVVNVPIPEEYEPKKLSMEKLGRLFLTVIAYNPNALRGENFLHLFRLLAPELYNDSNASRNILRDGIVALSNILLTKTASKNKGADENPIPPTESFDTGVLSQGTASSKTSNPIKMRLDYLLLVLAYTKAGGAFTDNAHIRIIEVLKALLLKDRHLSAEPVSSFIGDFAKSALLRHELPHPKHSAALLTHLAPVVSAYSGSVDFSALYDIIATLLRNPRYASDQAFANTVVIPYCRIGLDACELAVSDGYLYEFALRHSLLALIQGAVSVFGINIMTELERPTPSHDFLAGVVLPFALSLRTSADSMAASEHVDVHVRAAHTRAWLSLVTYTLNICHSVDEQGKQARKSSETKGTQDNYQSVMVFAIALQILKVIVIRAEDDISAALPGIWTQIGIILRSSLSDGDAGFALHFVDNSEPPSPTQSPRLGSFGEKQQTLSAFSSSISLHSRRSLCPPRMIDYLSWSFIHWLWLRRSPLMIEMRIFVQERIANLNEELNQRDNTPSSASARRSRRVSSMFSKPRRSFGINSVPSSPNQTPRNSFLAASNSMPVWGEFGSISSASARQAGFTRSISSSPTKRSSENSSIPKITHLGPTSPSAALGTFGAPRPVSPGGTRLGDTSVRAVAKEMIITSPLLIRTTYRHIRLVQHLMGYRTLLPMNGSTFEENDDPAVEVKAWTKRDALDAVIQETKNLLEEYRPEIDSFLDDSIVVVQSVDDDPF